MAFSEPKAVIVSLFVASVAYGFFTSLFCQSTSVILHRYKTHSETRYINASLFIVSTLLFLLATTHVSLTVFRVLDAFVTIGCTEGQNSDQAIVARLIDFHSPGYIAGVGTYGIETALVDGFMIYRTYVVWSGNIYVCIPVIITFLGSIATGVTFMFLPSHSMVWVSVFFWLTLLTNGVCTVLIAGRIWWVGRSTNQVYGSSKTAFPSNFGPVVTIIVESGAIYSFSQIIVIALYYVYGANDRNIVMQSMPQIMGIIFSFIIVRVASRMSSDTISANSDTIMRPKYGIAAKVTWPLSPMSRCSDVQGQGVDRHKGGQGYSVHTGCGLDGASDVDMVRVNVPSGEQEYAGA